MNKRETLSNMLIKLRKENKMNQKKFAEKIGVSQSNLSKWERCITLPDYENLCAIADKLGVTTDYLLGQTTVRNQKEKEKTETYIEETRRILEYSEFDNKTMDEIILSIYNTARILSNDDEALNTYRNAWLEICTNISTCAGDTYATVWHTKDEQKTRNSIFSLINNKEYRSLGEINNIFGIFSEKAKTVQVEKNEG